MLNASRYIPYHSTLYFNPQISPWQYSFCVRHKFQLLHSCNMAEIRVNVKQQRKFRPHQGNFATALSKDACANSAPNTTLCWAKATPLKHEFFLWLFVFFNTLFITSLVNSSEICQSLTSNGRIRMQKFHYWINETIQLVSLEITTVMY